MRNIIRHAIGLLVFSFLCKIAVQAGNDSSSVEVPKSLLLNSLAPGQPLPSEKIDSRKIIAALNRG